MPPTDPDSFDYNDLAELVRADEQLYAALMTIDRKYNKIRHHRIRPALGKAIARLVVTRQKLDGIMSELRRELS